MALPSEQKHGSSRELVETVLKVYRSASVVKGGRRFSFAALVVVGDTKGRVGFGYGKANEVPSAVDKAMGGARVNLRKVSLTGDTIPHAVTGSFGSTRVLLRPAAPGTGVIAGAGVRAVVEAAGIRNILSKVFGSRNLKNVVKATMDGLAALRTRADIERLRGVMIE
ncbi:MAG TPA: 30S ribosomal protein S5 [Planctomycetota bacterium]|nr:30S ribosomal protein S5 [Planctomycetota bacterium]